MASLVTGGAGFIGRHLVRLLLERGEAVRVLDLDPGPGVPQGAEFVRGSITDPAAVRAALQGVRRLYHLAANAQLWARPARVFEEVNHHGTRIVLAEAMRCGLERVVVTSSETVYVARAATPARATLDESVVLAPEALIGAYARSKRRAEVAALEAAAAGLPVIVVAPTMPLGPEDWRITPPTRMVVDLLDGRYPAYLDWTMNVIDARDAALGHLLAAEHGGIGERYVLGGTNLRMAEFLALLHELSGRAMPRVRVPYWLALASAWVSELIADHVTHRPPAAPLAGVRLARRQLPFEAAKARRELGLHVRPLRATLADCLAWLDQAGLVRRTARRPPHSRN